MSFRETPGRAGASGRGPIRSGDGNVLTAADFFLGLTGPEIVALPSTSTGGCAGAGMLGY